MKVCVPTTKDELQEKEQLETPQIRVWCHPHRKGQEGDDYLETFDNFWSALDFIKDNEQIAEKVPLIAFKGYEFNLWDFFIEHDDRQFEMECPCCGKRGLFAPDLVNINKGNICDSCRKIIEG